MMSATLELPDEHVFVVHLLAFGDAEDVYDQWATGNYACDCNRALFINREYGTHLPEHCGDTIRLLALTAYGQRIEL